MSSKEIPVEKNTDALKKEALDKKRIQLAKAREIAYEKRRALGNLTKTKKENKEKAYELIVAEEAEKQRVIMERLKNLERRKLEKKPKKIFKIEDDLKKEPEPSSDDEPEPAPKPAPKPVKKPKKIVAPPPSSESESESSEDEEVLRKKARREVRRERDAVLAERYKQNIEKIKLDELKMIMRGGRY